MVTSLKESKPKAIKEHICSYCGKLIIKGETYNNAFYVDGNDIWQWKSHISCQDLVNKFASREYQCLDRDEPVGENEFYESCNLFCRENICEKCEKWDNNNNECLEDKAYCLDKIKHSVLKGDK